MHPGLWILHDVTSGSSGSALELADDGLLAGRAADGDARAFAVLLRRHAPVLRAYVNRLTRRPSDGDDVLQEVALNAWQALPKLQDPDKVKAWLFRIAEREAFAMLRKHPQHEQIEEDLPTKEDLLESSDIRRALNLALGTLPERQARVWVLREVGGLSYEQIGQQLELPESTVRGALAAARKKLVDAMGGAQ